MEEKEYQIWWQLHRRAAKGETLSAAESQLYEAGLAALEAEEMAASSSSAPDWQTWQARWRELKQHDQQLAQQEAALRQQAAQLEQRYLS